MHVNEFGKRLSLDVRSSAHKGRGFDYVTLAAQESKRKLPEMQQRFTFLFLENIYVHPKVTWYNGLVFVRTCVERVG